MKITQIRNATIIIEYANKKFLIDPMLSDKRTLPPFGKNSRSDDRNPLVDLPFDIKTILDVDAVILTHLHADHFDQKAVEVLSKEIPIFVQNEVDYDKMIQDGFRNVNILDTSSSFEGIELIKTPGQHGEWNEAQLKRLGPVCGVVFRAEQEKVLYLTGDTIWYEPVEQALLNYKPEVVIANAGANSIGDYRLIMGTEDILCIHQTLPEVQIIATHMEDVNHWTLSRKQLRVFAKEHKFSELLFIPLNGESVVFEK